MATPKKKREILNVGDLVYIVKRKSMHPFNKGDAVWILSIAGGFMLTVQNYHRTEAGYLFYEEVSKTKPKKTRTYKR